MSVSRDIVRASYVVTKHNKKSIEIVVSDFQLLAWF